MKVYVEGYGCSLNQADTVAIKKILGKNFELSSLEEAELIVINTCAVKTPTENKMLRRIKEITNVKPNTKLIVFGCLSKINPEAVKDIDENITLIPPKLEELCKILNIKQYRFLPELSVERTTVVTIPIARGCLGECSYCCVKNARGKLSSYKIEQIKKSFENAIRKGAKEIRLTAQDLGCYGFDVGTNLIELLRELLKVEGNYRIRLGMMNPYYANELKHKIAKLFKDKRIYRFLHLPVQSGSNKILQLMKRKYSADDFIKLVKFFRKGYPEICISTDIIVGFPYENEEDFERSVNLLKEIQPDIVNVSRYGARPNTEAARFPQVNNKIKKKRSAYLSKLALDLSHQRNKMFVGDDVEVLVTEKGKKGNFVARMQNYKPVIVKGAKIGEFINVKIKEAFECYLKAC